MKIKRSPPRAWRTPVLLFSVFLTYLFAAGQSQNGQQSQFSGLDSISWSHQAWSTENGLPQNSVHQVLQSADGYIWIATEDGLARFDGTNFRVFNQDTDSAFASNDIRCLAQDSRGRLWIGTGDGLLEYSASAFRRLSTADALPSPAITSLAAADDGSLLVLTGSGLARFDGHAFSSLPLVPSAMARARDGSILLASSSGLFRYQQGSIKALSSTRGFVHELKESIDGIGALADDTIWLRTRSSIALLGNGTPQILRAGSGFPGNRFQAFFQDSRGILWIGTNKGLVSLSKTAEHALSRISEHAVLEEAIGADAVLSLFEDEEGNLWVGTDTDGLHILREQKFRVLPEFSGRAITAIIQGSDGTAWAGTNGDGLDRWRSGELRHFSTSNGLASDVILSLAAGARGIIWVGTPDGLNEVEGTTVKTYTSADGLPDDFIRSLLVDDDGSLWIGTRRGLAHWQNNRFTVLTSANGLKSDLIGALLKSRSHALWIATLHGLARLEDGQIKPGAIVNYTTKEGLSGDIVTALLEDSRGTLWVGTEGHGLSRSIARGFAPQPGRGLPMRVNSILEDDHGYLWLSSNHGITRVSASVLQACGQSPDCDPHVNSYGVSDGMPTEETSVIGHPTAWKAASGFLWFATRKGVTTANPDRLPENRIAPPVAIERFTVDDSQIALGPGKLAIAPGHNRFTFEYAGLSYVAPTKVRYRYMLEGFDKQWTSAGSRRIAYYTNLSPGQYVFRVQAANNDGVWNNVGARIAFEVQTPFYRKLWFLSLLLLLSGALLSLIITLLYRLRVRRLQAQFDAVLAERSRIAREIHDTLAQGFAGVSMQLELTGQLLAQSQVSAAHEQINRAREFVREGLAEARRTIRELRTTTAQDTLPVRLTRLAQHAVNQLVPVQLNISGPYRSLAPALESEVLRIAQEALTNVERHAAATSVSVDLRYDSNRLTLTIADNGQGFQISDTSLLEKGHFGLQGMRERAAQIGGQLAIESSPGKGARIRLEVPTVKRTKTIRNRVQT